MTSDNKSHFGKGLENTVEIYIPTQCICKKLLPGDTRDGVFMHAKKSFSEWFGGFSVTRIRGGWKLPDGTLVEEDIDVVWSKCLDEQLQEYFEDVKGLAGHVASSLTQDQVAITVNGKMAFFPPSSPFERCIHSTLSSPPPPSPPQHDTLKSVYSILQRFKSLSDARDLFCGALNYRLAPGFLSCINWPSSLTHNLVEVPRVLADTNGFRIVYLHLRSNKLSRGLERSIITRIYRDDPTFRGLFVVSNEDQTSWELVNAKKDKGERDRLLLRRMQVGPSEKVRTAAGRLVLTELSAEDEKSASYEDIQGKHDKAFDVEKVTDQFFKDYVKVFTALKQFLYKGTKNKDLKWAHEYALQFLNRIMFLYFIQRKRWLGDNPDFLTSFWDAYERSGSHDEFCSTWLSILFFEAFNNVPSMNRPDRKFLPEEIRNALAMAPYLNGGLFTHNDKDTKLSDYRIIIPDSIFAETIRCFNQYNFTISEDTPLDTEVAVDPEMIGKVYESLVNVSDEIDERGEAGVFYTPRIEIALMCRLSLVDYLSNNLPHVEKSVLYEFVFALEEDEKAAADERVTKAGIWLDLDEKIRSVTVCDPACGSGSFLIGMLELVTDLTRRINTHLRREESDFIIKKRIIHQSLFGVDVMGWAVEVCELRLWLQLIVDVDLDVAQRKFEALLPNLTFKIRQGDSLVQEVGGINFGRSHFARDIPKELKARITRLKNEKFKFYSNDRSCSFHTEALMKHEERRLFADILEDRERKIQEKIRELKNKIAKDRGVQIGLDGTLGKQSKQLTLDLENWQKELVLREAALKERAEARYALERAKEVPFVWDIAFVEIFEGEKEGFDIVIGNPPYVRQGQIADPNLPKDEVTRENKKLYKEKLARSVYQLFPRFFGYEHSTGTAKRKLDAKNDLYVYFYFHGLSLLNQRGSFCFITSNSWLDVGYGRDLQEFLLKHCHVKLVLDNQVKRTFSQADVNTVIVLFSAPDDRTETGLGKLARFAMFTVPFEQALSPVLFEEIEAARERGRTVEYRVFPVEQKSLFVEGSERGEEDHVYGYTSEGKDRAPAVKDKRSTGLLIRSARYIGNKWGGKYLRAPDIYWTILKKRRNLLVPLSKVIRYEYGIKPGAVNFFYIGKDEAKKLGIEKEYLKPLVNSSQHLNTYVIEPVEFLFYCHKAKSELKGTKAFEYIKWGESKKFHEVTSVRSHRPYWYSLNAKSFEFLLLQFWDKRFWCPVAGQEMYCSNNFFFGNALSDDDKPTLSGLLNSTFHFLQIELLGRVNQGQGVLNTYGLDYHYVTILTPSAFDKKLFDAFKRLSERPVKEIFEEVRQEDRNELDAIVSDVLGLTQSEQEALYEAMIYLVETRLRKADSL